MRLLSSPLTTQVHFHFLPKTANKKVYPKLTVAVFLGLFKIVPEEMPYSSIEEMVSLRPVTLESSFSFTFTCCSKMLFDNVTLGAGTALTVLSMEQQEGEEDKLRCKIHSQHGASAEILIPFSVHGEFVECESEEHFTLHEILSAPSLLSRRFCLISNKCDHQLILTPVYKVLAIMNRKKNFNNYIFTSTSLLWNHVKLNSSDSL